MDDDIFGEKAKDSEWDGAEVFGTSNTAPTAAAVPPPNKAARAVSPQPDVSYNGDIHGDSPSGAPEPMQAESDIPPIERSKHWYHISHWGYLFDVNTTDVLKRMLKTIWPLGPSFWHHMGTNPDYYGPFWIAVTLAFCTALTGNLGEYFASLICSYNNGTLPYFARVESAGIASATFLGWTFLLPLIFWGLFKWWKVKDSHLKNLVCLFGYSLAPYLPMSFICLIPHDYARWVAVCVGCAFNVSFLVLAIFQLLKEDHMIKALPTCVGAAALSVGLGFGLKFYFWSFTSCVTPAPGSTA